MAKKVPIETKVLAKLQELGTSAKEIAKSLKEKKIVGIQGDLFSCPLAKYLRKHFPRYNCGVTGLSVITTIRPNKPIYHSKPLQIFIVNFDSGKYPFLIDKDYEILIEK